MAARLSFLGCLPVKAMPPGKTTTLQCNLQSWLGTEVSAFCNMPTCDASRLPRPS